MNDLPLPTLKSAFDEQPIGITTKMNMDEYPPDFNPAQIQVKNQPLPLGKRLASKVWKVRKQALEELLKIVTSQNHKQFTQHESMIIKSMCDANIQCQLLSSRILFKYLEKQGFYEGDFKIIMKNVIEKLMTIEKQQMQSLSMDLLFWLMDHNNQEMFMMELNDYLLNKNPKIVAATMKILQNFVNNYGTKKLGNLEIFCKHLKILTEVARPTAKPQAVQMFKEIYRWMGDNIFQLFSIHPQIKEEVVKWSKTYQMEPMEIKRGLKKGEQGKKINPMEQQQESDTPVDILIHYDSRWVDTTLEIQKWQDKKQILQDFIKKTKVNAIVPRQTSHYITLVKRLFSENNINLLQCGFKIVRNLCKGLKKSFALSCKSFLSYVYFKLKDNKAMIVDETLLTLKAMTYSITLEDMQQEIKAGLKDKSPQMRLNTLKLLKQLSSKKQPKTTKIMKSMLDTLIALTNDSASDVRDVALSVLCKIKQHQGMIFFEDKLQGLPAKKINQIRSTATIGNNQSIGSSMQVEQPSFGFNLQKSTSNLSEQNSKSNAATKPIVKSNVGKNVQVAQSKSLSVKSSNIPKPIVIEKKPSQTSQNSDYEQKNATNTMVRMPVIYEESQQNNTARELQQIRNQEWPITPTPGHVLRLINYFTKIGEPLATLATPFKLKKVHFEILENCDNNFMQENADLLLKWALWRVQTQDPQTTQSIMSVVIHLIFLLKNTITDSQTFLVMSILANSLQCNFPKLDLLVCANASILEISQVMREKMFNFWLSTLQYPGNDVVFCEKILMMLRITFQNFNFTNNEIVAMARVQFIVKNKKFVQFLLTKCNGEFLKVSGFKFQEQRYMFPRQNEQKFLLKIGGPQFCINIKPQEAHFYYEIFRKSSIECLDQIRKLQDSCAINQVIGLHLKIMDTIMLSYLKQSLQSINIYNYFKHLTNKIIMLCDPKNGFSDAITPYLRNLMRLLMFFMLDLSESKLDNKDQMVKMVNRIILMVLDAMPAEHLIQVLTMLLKHSVKNELNKRLNPMLLKCIMKVSKSASFKMKSQKNVKSIINFFTGLIQEENIAEEELIIRSIKSLFLDLFTNFKELCLQIVIEKLNQYNGELKNKDIEHLLKNFVGHINQRNNAQQISNENMQHQYQRRQFGEGQAQENIDMKVIENYQMMSNLRQNYQGNNMNNLQVPQKEQLFNRTTPQVSNNKIKQATNTYSTSSAMKPLNMKSKPLNPENNEVVDLTSIQNNGGLNMRVNPVQRRRLQNMQGLNQSLEELLRLREGVMTQQQGQNIDRNNNSITQQKTVQLGQNQQNK